MADPQKEEMPYSRMLFRIIMGFLNILLVTLGIIALSRYIRSHPHR